MDQREIQKVNQAAGEWTEAVRQSFQTLADKTVTLQESNLKLTQSFFQQFVEQLQSQTQGNERDTQALQEQNQRLSRESADAYSDFLINALTFYQQTLQQATQVAQSTLQTAEQVAQRNTEAADQAMQSNLQAARQGVEAANQAARETTGRRAVDEGRLALLERRGEVKIGSGRLPADFWDLPRPEDPEGLVRRAVQEDRR